MLFDFRFLKNYRIVSDENFVTTPFSAMSHFQKSIGKSMNML